MVLDVSHHVAHPADQQAAELIKYTVTEMHQNGRATGLPTVLRGWPSGSPRIAAKPKPKRVSPGWIATGGETLRLVERDGGRVVGCWLQGSTQVSEIDVLCGRGAWR